MKIKIDNLDRLLSQYVRLKADYTCKACKKQFEPAGTQCAHIFGRRSKSTRWHLDNLVCLCVACHFRYGERPHDWNDLTLKWLGEKKFWELRRLYNNGPKVTDAEKEAIGLEIIEKIEKLGAKPVCGLGINKRHKRSSK